MKILHTSDWHLGHVLHKQERRAEQAAMLQQMIRIVDEEQPDLFLVSGDIFHTAQPTAEAQKLFNDTVVALHAACPSMTIVITAGNHDSGVRLETYKVPWEYFDVHICGTYDSEHPERHIIELAGKGYVIALPYVNEYYLKSDTFQRLTDMVAARNVSGLPVVFSAHTALSGADYKGHDHSSDDNIGGITAMPVEAMGEGYDYLALGHIHAPQFVHTGRHNVRYSGSPIAVSFDEDYPHSVTIAEINHHGENLTKENFRTVEITNIRPLVTLPTRGTAALEEAAELLRAFPDDIPAYIRLNVSVKESLPDGILQELKEAEWLQRKQCVLCYINEVRADEVAARSDGKEYSVQEFKQLSPIQIAAQYAQDEGKEFGEDLQELFRQVTELINEEDREA